MCIYVWFTASLLAPFVMHAYLKELSNSLTMELVGLVWKPTGEEMGLASADVGDNGCDRI